GRERPQDRRARAPHLVVPRRLPGVVVTRRHAHIIAARDGVARAQAAARRRSSGSARAQAAAARPETTALSIVAGRPVCTQSPARKRFAIGVVVAGRARSAAGGSESVAWR